jgi:hypothetical protein
MIKEGGGTAGDIELEMSDLPKQIKDTLKSSGFSVVATNASVAESPLVDGNGHPRGWGPIATYADVPGIYLPSQNTAIVATSGQKPTSSINLTLHEIGHAYDNISGGLSRTPGFMKAYNADRSGLTEYYRQPGSAGPSEAFAESFAAHFSSNQSFASMHPALTAYWNGQ